MRDTLSPCDTNRGMSRSISVVLPLPDQPANPNTFMLSPRGAVRGPRPRRQAAVDCKALILAAARALPALVARWSCSPGPQRAAHERASPCFVRGNPRRCGALCRTELRLGEEPHGKRRALARLARHRDPAAVALHERVGDRQAEPGALASLRREERVEDARRA